MELICQMIKKKLTTCECRVKVYLAVSVKKEIKRLQLKDEHFSCKIKLSKQMQSKTMYI